MIEVPEKMEIVQFKDGDFILDVNITPNEEQVWLTQDQMAVLFDVNRSSITRHISNIFRNEELDEKTSVRFLHESKNLKNRPPKYYDLDVIIGVGYKVNSKRGIIFRRWANTILKDYLLKGYSINENYYNDTKYIIQFLEKYRSMGGELPSGETMLDFLKSYQRGFLILDEYDHHSLSYPEGSNDTYRIEYKECIDLIHNTVFANKGDLFSVEKDDSFKSSIATIYQSFGGQDLYPTLEDKASALLYFIVKNHSFADGNKRIGATVFLYFLERNDGLYKGNDLRISEETLAILTILIAVSEPKDKEMIMRLVKTVLN